MVADDGDLVRGLGFVTMYSAWLEEEVDELLRALDPIEQFDDATQRWPISRKLDHAAALVRRLNSAELGELVTAIGSAAELYTLANEFWDYRGHFIGPLVFHVPRAVRAFLDRPPLIP